MWLRGRVLADAKCVEVGYLIGWDPDVSVGLGIELWLVTWFLGDIAWRVESWFRVGRDDEDSGSHVVKMGKMMRVRDLGNRDCEVEGSR